MNTLSIKNVSKSFGKKKILSNINLEITTGMFGLLGSNGVGKTTLMRMITTLLVPDNGTITFNNIDCVKEPEKIRRLLGYLPQQFGSFRGITARKCLDYIAVLKGLHNKEERNQEIDRILEEVNLLEYSDMKIRKFSGGMIRRLGIAQALLGNPQLLIVDEPTAGLDPEERIRFRSLLRKFSENRTVLLSTHIVEDIAATCKGVAVLKKEKIEYFSSLSKLASVANNKVWKFTNSNEDKFDELSKKYIIVSTQALSEGIEYKVISDEKPTENAIPTKPSIEEGYIVWNNQ